MTYGKRVIEMKCGNAWVTKVVQDDPLTVNSMLAEDMIAKYVNKAAYVASVKRLYGGNIIVTYRNVVSGSTDLRAVYETIY